MKKVAYFGAVALAGTLILAGCASNKTHGEIAEQYESFKKAVAERQGEYVPCGDRAVDDVGTLSNQVHYSFIKYLDEYVKMTENHRYYIGFLNDTAELAKEKNISIADAQKQILEEYKAEDLKKKAEDQIYPKVKEGFLKVQSLNPGNKLKELAPIGVQATKVSLQAKKTADTVNKTYGSIKFNDVQGMRKKAVVTAAIPKIIKQCEFNIKGVDFLQDQFRRNMEMKDYMQK